MRSITHRIGIGFTAIMIALAITFAIRDSLGVHDVFEPAGFDKWRGYVRIVELAFAAAISWKCGDRSEGRILSGALIGLSLNNNWWFYSADDWWIWPAITLNYLGVAYGVTQLVRFATSYTTAGWRNVRKHLGRFAPVIGVWMALFGMLWSISFLIWKNYNFLWDELFWIGWDVGNITVISASVVALINSKGADRSRMIAVASSFCIAAFGTAVHGLIRANHRDPAWVEYFDTTLQLALPIGLTYAIARYRFLDIEFVLSWGPICIALSALLSASEVLIEHFAGSAAARRGGEAAEIGVSLAIVFAIKPLLSRVDASIEHIRSRPIDEKVQALRDFAEREVPTLNDASSIADRLVRTIEVNAAANAVALFRKVEAMFVRISSTMVKAPPSVPEADPAVRQLESLRRPAVIDVSGTVLPKSHAFPMVARAKLGGFVLCEAKSWSQRQEDAICEAVNAATLAMEDARVAELERRIQELESVRRPKRQQRRRSSMHR